VESHHEWNAHLTPMVNRLDTLMNVPFGTEN
jgi:hypothetical protein